VSGCLPETSKGIEPTHDDGGTGCEKLFGDFDTFLSLLAFSISVLFFQVHRDCTPIVPS
jgi:hypothetical protein